ncbi:MAG TPA: SGNH/GDSL hydrolase family protein [Pirellulales bacterium]|jgi:lysophospholipase L1-like esterase|nr:SGNH/GDSL hydrolase family protein [Pirellulales bacterium]
MPLAKTFRSRRIAAALTLTATLLTAGISARAVDNAAPATGNNELKLKNLRVGKLLFLGNSITQHGPKPEIGWTGNWGMAASAQDKDYVHVLATHIGKAAGGEPQILAKNIADFERGHPTYDVAAGMKDELAFRPDVVIVAIGENVPPLDSAEAKTKYRDAFVRLLTTLTKNGHPAIFVRSCFWPNPEKDELMKQAAAETGAIYVDVGALGGDPANAARSERAIEHAGVAGHPGDRGMQAIADALWKAIDQRAGEKP